MGQFAGGFVHIPRASFQWEYYFLGEKLQPQRTDMASQLASRDIWLAWCNKNYLVYVTVSMDDININFCFNYISDSMSYKSIKYP